MKDMAYRKLGTGPFCLREGQPINQAKALMRRNQPKSKVARRCELAF